MMLLDAMGIKINYNRNPRLRKKYNDKHCDSREFILALGLLARNIKVAPHNTKEHLREFKEYFNDNKNKHNTFFKRTRLNKYLKLATGLSTINARDFIKFKDTEND